MISILVLENTDVGVEYVNLLREYRQVDWNISWVTNVSDAVEYARKNKIHVLVFDQRLDNNELGTTAFKEIIKENSLVQGIMLSGMATAEELSEAERLAGSCLFLSKKRKDILELPYKVEEAIIKFYLSPRNRIMENKEIKIKNPFFSIRHKARLILLYQYLIDDNFFFKERWRVEDRARAGISLTETESHQWTNRVIVTLKNKVNHNVKFGVNLKYIETSIGSFFENELLNSYETINESKITRERKITLPSIPDDPQKDFLTELRYEVTPVYEHYRAHFSLDCTLCGGMSFFDFDVYKPKNKLLSRQMSYYTDGNRKEIFL